MALEADRTYVVEREDEFTYAVQKYEINDEGKEVKSQRYRVSHGKCDCWGFRANARCKHVDMVLKFDPRSMTKFSAFVTGVREEQAHAIYARIATGLDPFVKEMHIEEFERNSTTDGIVKMRISGVVKDNNDRHNIKLTGIIDGVTVELLLTPA